jgi:hypothetical protein
MAVTSTESVHGPAMHVTRTTRRLDSRLPGIEILETTTYFLHPDDPGRDGFVRQRRRRRRSHGGTNGR